MTIDTLIQDFRQRGRDPSGTKISAGIRVEWVCLHHKLPDGWYVCVRHGYGPLTDEWDTEPISTDPGADPMLLLVEQCARLIEHRKRVARVLGGSELA